MIHRDEQSGVYLVDVPDIPSVVTEGATPREAAENAREAISAHIEMLRELGQPLPIPASYEPVTIAV